MGWGYRTNAPAAAFANGVFGHCLDYEIQGFPPTHGTSSCLPAALALAEQQRAAGRQVIVAYALGWEVQGTVAGGLGPGYRAGLPSAGIGRAFGRRRGRRQDFGAGCGANADGFGHRRLPHRRADR